MANRVTIYIHNQSYNFLAEEDASYLQQCADIVNKEMDEAMSGTTISLTDGAVLAAMNVADKYCKERAVSDNLRAQLKQALDENARLAPGNCPRPSGRGRKPVRGAPPPKQPRQSPPSPPAKRDNPWNCWPRRVPGGPPGRRPSRGGRGVPGLRPLNARRNAKNFTREQLEEGWPTATSGG